MTERGCLICARVAKRIGEVAPRGLGHWEGAWEIVAGPSDAFLDRIHEWEADDAPETRAALEDAVNDFVRAWRVAAALWEAAGRPGPELACTTAFRAPTR